MSGINLGANLELFQMVDNHSKEKLKHCFVFFLFFFCFQLQDGYGSNSSNNNGSNGGSQQCVSQPATPGGALPVPSPLSPSPASLSSYHGDDSDSISSPPWPLKTPSSPVRAQRGPTLFLQAEYRVALMRVCLVFVIIIIIMIDNMND